ncbi:MAG: ferrous iron transport protein B [Flavobacteriales bacterium]|jgi:ferrous iron transport protein B|nr:ferrous iron transport protein B [Flavobacteriales bacterium]
MNSYLSSNPTIALVGNPNSGKTSIFNALTGLNQQVGNFPGVTVEKISGHFSLGNKKIRLIDLPGSYSIHPTSFDEREVAKTLCQPNAEIYPDAIIYVADINNLERQLLLFSQIIDLKIPTLLCLNMIDLAEDTFAKNIKKKVEDHFGTTVILCSTRNSNGLTELREALKNEKFSTGYSHYELNKELEKEILSISKNFQNLSTYQIKLLLHHDWIPNAIPEELDQIKQKTAFSDILEQVEETKARIQGFQNLIPTKNNTNQSSKSENIDRILTHKWFGPLIFFLIMGFVFQSIFAWAAYPMDWIDGLMGSFGNWASEAISTPWLSTLVADGIIAGIGSVVIFIPQIFILFVLLSILEEIGYMSRAVYLFDSWMQKFGLNGRSIIALISGSACAIPAIMSARTIKNPKERLITIFVTPFMSCSARIPVYVLLIGMIVEPVYYFGFINLQGLAFFGLYLLGIVAALLVSIILKWILKESSKSYLVLELPSYKNPNWTNVLLSAKEKVMSFVIDAGKIIMILSVVIWFLSSYGPQEKMDIAQQEAQQEAMEKNLNEQDTDNLIASKKLEVSYAGIVGKTIEPAIKPLGFDWKIGIALVTSFAAREVFVSTMATINSIGEDAEENTLKTKLLNSKNSIGKPIFTPATTWALLVFYVLAMQCIGTLAVVKRETQSWKWPLLQVAVMTGMAYFLAWATFVILNK